jgi:threonine synthase
MWKYFDWLPVDTTEYVSTLGEGHTPLVLSSRIGPSLGLDNLFFKLESQNPTGSYKDRFASVAASLMRQHRKGKMIATSSGNTGSALAAYAARFGFELDLYVTEQIPEEKLRQSLAYGACIYRVVGLGVDAASMKTAMSKLHEKAQRNGGVLLISAVCQCPLQMQGVKTIAFEICDQLNEAPDHVFIPVGGGGLFLSCFQGFREFHERNSTMKLPHLHPVQPEGCATVVGPLTKGKLEAEGVKCTSNISGLQVAGLLDAQEVLEKTILTEGKGHMVSDELIYYWQSRLIREEGIYTEPAGAASMAGLVDALEKKQVEQDNVIVCLITGNGSKDMKSVQKLIGDPEIPLINASDL